MAVLDTGERAGNLSSGCVEAAITAEALEALTDGVSRRVRLGRGSRYIDIRLPCGAGMDLLFVPRPDPGVIRHATARLDDRRPVTLSLTDTGAISCWEGKPSLRDDDEGFLAQYTPELRLIVAGQGAEADALVRQGRAYGTIVELLTPDEDLLESAIGEGVSARLLEHVTEPPRIHADPWTAVAVMFHDHDWEPRVLDAALKCSAFWIGAMGSSRTADRRRAMLAERGWDRAAIERIKGPIGSIPSTRDPSTLALSALADIVAAFGEGRD
jgi:xanthine dehydrogenase accessory factor